MADKYTVEPAPAVEAPEPVALDDKDRMVTRSWSERQTESFTIRQLENEVSHCEAEIERCEARIVELQAKIDSATSAISS